MAELLEPIEKRRAYRALSEKKIPGDVVQRILKAATFAPSCFNKQPWRFVAAESEEALQKIKTALPDGNYWVKKSPLIIMALTKNDLDCRLSDNRNYAFFDVGLAVENLILQAVSEGLIAHPIAGYNPVKIKEAFQIPDEYILLNLVIAGYPGDDSHLSEEYREKERSPRERKPMEEVVTLNEWKF